MGVPAPKMLLGWLVAPVVEGWVFEPGFRGLEAFCGGWGFCGFEKMDLGGSLGLLKKLIVGGWMQSEP